jgi:hypothetical protein
LNPKLFIQKFNTKYSLRLHMSILLSLMLVSAIGLNKLLVLMGLDHLVLRYGLVTVLGYLCFFVYLRLWILCLFPNRRPGSSLHGDDLLSSSADIMTQLPSGKVPKDTAIFFGDGGGFSGGGASSSWSEVGESIPTLKNFSLPDVSLDEDSIAIPIVLIIVAAMCALAMVIVCGAMLVTAPSLLGEVALEVALGIGLAKRMNKNLASFSAGPWFLKALKKTYVLFLFVLLSNLILAAVAMHYFPEATSFSEVLKSF